MPPRTQHHALAHGGDQRAFLPLGTLTNRADWMRSLLLNTRAYRPLFSVKPSQLRCDLPAPGLDVASLARLGGRVRDGGMFHASGGIEQRNIS